MFCLPQWPADIDCIGCVGERGSFVDAVHHGSCSAKLLEVEMRLVDNNLCAVYIANGSC
jgi:hypothetical protein